MAPALVTALAAAGLVLLLIAYVLRKGRRLPGAHVFGASGVSRGNRIFRAQVIVGESSITHLRPQWIGKYEESIHISHVASIRIDTHILYSDVYIESTGGQNPIECHGHTKRDAVTIKRLVEQYQSAFYRKGAPRPDRSGSAPA